MRTLSSWILLPNPGGTILNLPGTWRTTGGSGVWAASLSWIFMDRRPRPALLPSLLVSKVLLSYRIRSHLDLAMLVSSPSVLRLLTRFTLRLRQP